MKEGVEFDQWRSKSRTIETWTLAVVIFIHVALVTVRVTLTIMGRGDIEIHKTADTLIFIY